MANSKILKDINSVLIPRVCFGCSAQLYRGEYLLCVVCRNNLPLTDFTYTQDNMVDRVFYGRIPVKKAASLLYYSKSGFVKNLLYQLKYNNQEAVGAYLGRWFAELHKDALIQAKIDLVIPVPLHPKKQKKRGYNQVTQFAISVAELIDAQYADDLLIKTTDTSSQTVKNRFKRWQSSLAIFTTTNNQKLQDKTILLVDDIITTGATMEACSNALLKAKGVKLYIGSIAVVPQNAS